MNDSWRFAGWALGALAMRQAWLIATAARTPTRAEPFQSRPRDRRARLLVIGDSTGSGVGVQDAESSLPGLLAAEFVHLQIVNRCRSGARVRDTLAQVLPSVQAGARFDAVLLCAGGNDVLRLTGAKALRRDASELLLALNSITRRVVWLGCADMGVAPALLPPLSWWLGWRSRCTMRLLNAVASAAGTEFIDFCQKHHTRRLAAEPAIFFAADGLHPSGAAHRYCFETLKRRVHALAGTTWASESPH